MQPPYPLRHDSLIVLTLIFKLLTQNSIFPPTHAPPVVYFDQPTGASEAVRWSKSFFGIKTSFPVFYSMKPKKRRERAKNNKKNMHKMFALQYVFATEILPPTVDFFVLPPTITGPILTTCINSVTACFSQYRTCE